MPQCLCYMLVLFFLTQPPTAVDNKPIVVFAVTNTVFASHAHPSPCNGPYPLIMKIAGEENRERKRELQHGPISLASLSVAKQISTTIFPPHVISQNAEEEPQPSAQQVIPMGLLPSTMRTWYKPPALNRDFLFLYK